MSRQNTSQDEVARRRPVAHYDADTPTLTGYRRLAGTPVRRAFRNSAEHPRGRDTVMPGRAPVPATIHSMLCIVYLLYVQIQ